MNTHKITVNGVELTRNSEKHTYTHAIVGIHSQKQEQGWVVIGWCGSEALAMKRVKTERNCKFYGSKNCVWSRVELVPVGATVEV